MIYFELPDRTCALSDASLKLVTHSSDAYIVETTDGEAYHTTTEPWRLQPIDVSQAVILAWAIDCGEVVEQRYKVAAASVGVGVLSQEVRNHAGLVTPVERLPMAPNTGYALILSPDQAVNMWTTDDARSGGFDGDLLSLSKAALSMAEGLIEFSKPDAALVAQLKGLITAYGCDSQDRERLDAVAQERQATIDLIARRAAASQA